ncbi:alpha-glucosidase [Salipaludibacillus agaradhaerens]|uniref:glycoside hydrolase family 13 protein n=1 Tax=Salipaludibacillus agaradhaerens TaxID=76935 RepID=UPI0021514095|nr:alpha-glucosidase [Salipaludibacillus agaradhaerens]MCR6105758.1 alpha-glucosidase [Salipaludibacillus agaradhaerens]MCR6117794.1 alpha-glucosidase [Salipaludibacillus agaradhaerens]
MGKVWWKEGVGYQVYPRSFQDSNGDGFGDLQGIVQRLDYLKDLGIDFIWLSPMYKSPLDDNGYDISDYQEILEEFGTMGDFDALLNEVHARGMRLIIDLVLNHTSDEHPWFIESRQSKENDKRDWYIWRDGRDGKEPNNWESIFGGSAWEFNEQTNDYFLHVFSKKQPDLNWENPEVRETLYDTVNWWLKKGIDGFRIDAISHIKKRPGLPDMPREEDKKYVSSFDMHMNQEGIMAFLQEFRDKTYGQYPNAMTVGEANGVTVEEAPQWAGDDGVMDMVFQFEHLDLWDQEGKKGLDVVAVKRALTRWQKALEHDGWNALFIENHDKARVVSTWGNDTDYWRESATSLAAMYFLMKGTPYIYQGQEIGMTNGYFTDIEDYDDVAAKNLYREQTAAGMPAKDVLKLLARTSRDNSRTPMQWSAVPNAGFTEGTPWLKVNPNFKKVNVANQLEDEQSILHFYKKLIQLKKKYALFPYGSYDLLLEDDEQIIAYKRQLNDKIAVIISNLSPSEAEWRSEDNNLTLTSERLVLANYDVTPHGALTSFKLKPFEARVYIF